MINFILINILLLIQPTFLPQTGDLLFQDIDCGPLCDAIEQVTTGIEGARFSHVGLVVEKEREIFVLEAISKGVTLTPLSDFLKRSSDSSGNPKVLVGRLKPQYMHLIPMAINEAEKYFGKSYDTVFSISNDSYYCSELLYFSFKSANGNIDFFKLSPMTFKSAGSDIFFKEWKNYFDSMKIQIPEGKPGINPGGISRSDLLDIVYEYGKPDGYENKKLVK
jgi:hypothetical protein